jgi:hypothetical protein
MKYSITTSIVLFITLLINNDETQLHMRDLQKGSLVPPVHTSSTPLSWDTEQMSHMSLSRLSFFGKGEETKGGNLVI